MNAPDREFDPDDNFENSREHEAPLHDEDDEASVEALVWQLLLVINPGDEEVALRQFDGYRDAVAAEGGDEDGSDPMARLKDVIDWTSGFHVEADDPATFIDAVNELVARWNLSIDWGVEDVGDDEFLAATDVPELMATAYDRLREYGYTLWTWDAGADAHAGWITLSRDDDAVRVLAPALGIDVRPGSDAF
ncbi:DUF6630 family protein [Lysobacter sp. F6437]|uniref:DUF6630 family protein n=1 Tax=Lysobacter sp. F6437 TaxID=3459296 RepID=UPI00403E2524